MLASLFTSVQYDEDPAFQPSRAFSGIIPRGPIFDHRFNTTAGTSTGCLVEGSQLLSPRFKRREIWTSEIVCKLGL